MAIIPELLLKPKNQILVPEVVTKSEASIDGGLRESCGNSKLGERMIIKEQRIQVLAQGIIGSELKRE